MKYYNWIKRLAIGALAALMLLSAVSCGNGGEGDETQAVTKSEEETGEQSAYDTVAKQKYNREFGIVTRKGIEDDFKVDQYTGDVLDDAVYERNVTVSEDFGITFSYEIKDNYDQVNQMIITQAGSNLDEYDLYIGQKQSYKSCVQNGYLYDLMDIDSLNLDRVYWDQAFNAAMNVEDKAFVATGDISPFSMRITSCLTFNKKMLNDRQIAYPYALVDSGDWTMDALLTMTTDVTNKDLGEDRAEYGFTCWTMDVPFSLFYGTGGMFVGLDEDKLPELTFKNEDVINRYEKIYKLIVEQDAYHATDASNYDKVYEIFMDGRAMFCDLSLSKIASTFGEMEDYGIVPVPKYDKHQDNYLSFVNGAVSLTMISKAEKDPEFVGAIMEAMAAYNYDNVTPNMYESVVKLKAARDPDSPRMVDYILRYRIFDFAYMADMDISNLVQQQLTAGNSAISSKLSAGNRRQAESQLSKIVRDLQKEPKA